MTLTATEQYLLEMINRGRLDPAAEAARFGVSLNSGLAVGTITTAAKQVLAPNAQLESAATDHSLWMLASDTFSHTGAGGTSPGQRATAKGYSWSSYGENIAWTGTTGTLNFNQAIDDIYKNLFLSSGHRQNSMASNHRELGVGAEQGVFTSGGTNYNAAMVTELFGTSGTQSFVTGVAYQDSDANKFYSIGEGQAGVTLAAQAKSTTTAPAGGYALGLTAGTAVTVTGNTSTKSFSVTVDLSHGNVKLDLVNGTTFKTSGNVTLGTGINNVDLLGVDRLNATGNASANAINGNKADNVLDGQAGADSLFGALGKDVLKGGDGNDRLSGGAGTDLLTGGLGADRFVFNRGFGTDTITDFSGGQSDLAQLHHTLWSGTLTEAQVIAQFARTVTGGVVLDFGTDELLFSGLTTTSDLSGHLMLV